MRYPHDVVGQALAPYPMYGYPAYPGALAFGAAGDAGGAPAAPPLDPAVVAAAQNGHPQAQAIVEQHMRTWNPYMNCGWGPAPGVLPSFTGSMTAQRHAVYIGPQNGPQEFETTMGFDSQDPVAPGETRKFRAVAEYPFKINGLFIHSGIASQITVLGLTVGVKGQFANSNPQPGLIFQEAATGRIMNGDTIQSQQAAVLEILNNSNAELTFTGALRGVGVQGFGPQIVGGPAAY